MAVGSIDMKLGGGQDTGDSVVKFASSPRALGLFTLQLSREDPVGLLRYLRVVLLNRGPSTEDYQDDQQEGYCCRKKEPFVFPLELAHLFADHQVSLRQCLFLLSSLIFNFQFLDGGVSLLIAK